LGERSPNAKLNYEDKLKRRKIAKTLKTVGKSPWRTKEGGDNAMRDTEKGNVGGGVERKGAKMA